MSESILGIKTRALPSEFCNPRYGLNGMQLIVPKGEEEYDARS